MSKIKWRNGFTVGLTIGVLGTVLFAVYGQLGSDLANCIGENGCEGFAAKYDGAQMPDWWWWSWTGELVTSGDTLANWIIAILTIVAVVLLWQTLVQTNKTNQAAIDAANAATEANEIMRMEQRPWLRLKWQVRCEFNQTSRDRFQLAWTYQFLNKGKGPAHNIHFVYNVYRYDPSKIGAGRHGVDDIVRRAKDRIKSGFSSSTGTLFPGETTEFLPPNNWSMRGTIDGDDTGKLFLCACLIYSLDPFNKKVGYEAKALVLESRSDDFGPLAARLLEINEYSCIE